MGKASKRPGTEAQSTGPDATALEAEGAGYALALLDRIAAGASSADDLAGTLLFLGAGQMLHGAAAVLFATLRLASDSVAAAPAGPAVQTPAPGAPDAR
jgi:hypothetical protein